MGFDNQVFTPLKSKIMIHRLKHLWLYGPADLDSADLRGVLYIYRIYLIGYVLSIINLAFGHLAMPPSALPAFYWASGFVFLTLICGGVLLYKQAWKAAIILVFSITWVSINGVALLFRGVQDPIIGLHIPVLIGVAYYFDFKRSLTILIADLVVLSGITFIHEMKFIEGMPTSMFSQSGDLFYWTVTFLAAGAIIFLSTQRANDAKADVEIKNQMLAEQRAALEIHKSNLEQLVLDRTEQLEWAKNKAEKANNAKSTFLAKMSHELRTPLNIIIGYSEMILEDPEKQETIQKDTTRIHAAGQHLLNIIDTILELSKIEEGKWQVNIETVHVPNLMEEIAFLAIPLMQKQNNQLDFVWNLQEPASRSELSIWADKQMLTQVFINLLSNAAKFTHSGNVSIHISHTDLPDGRHMAVFEVSDTGKGINQAFLPHIFSPFQQEENSFARKHEGTGLGLAIAKEMINQMNGKISAENNKHGGATFKLLLPMPILELA